jgi:hypothetical protein
MKLKAGKENKFRIRKRPCDRLGLSGNLLIALFGVSVLCLAVLISDTCFRPVDDHTGRVIRALNLSNLSIVGSGRPLRHPEGVIVSVNLNFSPYVTHFIINPEYLILNAPQYSKGHVVP